MSLSQQSGIGSEVGITPTTRTFTYPELIAREILTLYKAEYATSLATVQTFWQNHPLLQPGEREMPLHDFAERLIVADITSLASFTGYPALVIGVGAMTPTDPARRSQQGFDWYQQVIQPVYMLRALSQQELAIVLMRHMQATLDLFGRFPKLNVAGETFTIQGTPTLQPSANVIPDGGGNALVKGLLVTLNIKFLGPSSL